MRTGCYIILPRKIMMKRAVVNVRSKDNACFAWAVTAAMYPAERRIERELSYPRYTDVLNLRDIEFSVTLNQIKKFEINNNISINVYTIENENIVPIRLSEQKRDKHANLLYIQDAQDIGHFAWIKNLSRLVSSQLNKHNGQKYICDRCLHYFYSNEKLQSHTADCGKMNDCAIRLPSDKDKWLAFNNYNRKEQVPFVVYADLECVLRKTDKEEEAEKNVYQHHQVFSKTTVNDIINKFKTTGSVADRPRSGRPWKTTARVDKLIRRKSVVDVRKTACMIAQELRDENLADVSRITVSRRLRDIGLFGRISVKKPLISKKNPRARLQFAENHKDWTVQDWKKVLFSDESKFKLFGMKHGGGGVTVWGAFSYEGVGPLVGIEGVMDRFVYKDIFDKQMLLYAKDNMPHGWIFQHDRDPKHASKIVSQYLSAKKVRVLE
ncbi:uncharacterized protein [Anoplolepis gracilipes]|uniref:uncharacterized protein n=1 Tax=Anoplolepis gracilipes TaxID=354296 RepID=UPI003B9FD296